MEAEKLSTRPIEVVDECPAPEEVFKVPKLVTKALVLRVLGPAAIPLGVAISSGE